MKQLKKHYLVFIFFLIGNMTLFAQAQLTAQNSQHIFPNVSVSNASFDANQITDLSQPNFALPTPPLTSCMIAPKVYDYNHLGAFCKLDVQLEKVIRMPVKFRLGTVNYVDRLEGKGVGRLPKE